MRSSLGFRFTGKRLFPEETATDDRAKAVACHECGLVHAVRRVPGGGVAKCSRCGAVLYRDVIDGIDRTLMLTLASLILFVGDT